MTVRHWPNPIHDDRPNDLLWSRAKHGRGHPRGVHHPDVDVLGETLEIICETVEGFLNPHDDYLCSEHISTARCGALVGFFDNELTNNPRLGSAWPPNPLYVTDGDGLSPCPIRPHRTWRNH
jgi:hypothetical protein